MSEIYEINLQEYFDENRLAKLKITGTEHLANKTLLLIK